MGQDLGWAMPRDDDLGPVTRLTLPWGPCGSRAAASLQGRQAWGPPEMHLLHFVAVRVSLAGVS